MKLSELSNDELLKLRDQVKPKRDLSQMSDEELLSLSAKPTELSAEGKQDKFSKAEGLLQGFGQAATFGYLPTLQAKAEPFLRKAYNVFATNDVPEQDPMTTRKEFIARDKALEDEEGGAMLAGRLAGSLALPAGGAGKAVGLTAKAARAALTGAGYAAVENVGYDEEGNAKFALSDRVKNALAGGALGGALGGVAGVFAKSPARARALAQKAQEVSDNLTVKSVGAMKRDFKELFNKDKIEDVADWVRSNKLLNQGNDPEAIANVTRDIMRKSGERIGSVYKITEQAAEDAIASGALTKSQKIALTSTKLDPKKLVKSVARDTMEKYADLADGKKALKAVQDQLKVIAKIPEEKAFDKLFEFRKSLDDIIDFKKPYGDSKVATKALVDLRQGVEKALKARIQAVGDVIGEPQLVNNLAKNQFDYSMAATINKIASDRAAAEMSNRTFGLTSTILGTGVGAAGAAGGAGFLFGPLMGIVTGIATKKALEKGPRLASEGLPKLARGLKSVSRATSKLRAPMSAERLGLLTQSLDGPDDQR